MTIACFIILLLPSVLGFVSLVLHANQVRRRVRFVSRGDVRRVVVGRPYVYGAKL